MMAKHLLSRSLEFVEQYHGKGDVTDDIQLPGLAMVAVIATVTLYLVIHTAINYTYGILVPTLVILEAPTTTTVIQTTTVYRDDVDDENPDAPLLTKEEKESQLPRDEEVLAITHAPLTARFRTIIAHLKTKTGSATSRFRAAGGFMIYCVLQQAVSIVSADVLGRFAFLLETPLLACFCLFSAAWVQQTVAMPGKNYFARLAELKQNGAFKKLFLPSLVVTLVTKNVMLLPQTIVDLTLDIKNIDDTGVLVATSLAIAFAGIAFLACLLYSLVPLNMALVRLQASLLPNDTETVIPIDRSLGEAEEKVMKAAWESITRASVWRLIKTWIKAGIMQIAVGLVFATAVVVELRLLAPAHFDRLILKVHAKLNM